ncbi:MAG: hypothetical protein JOY97_14060 [Hyphomicrobiales bacterium]|nr:hypothetical protein [Hyphomicrobiales bacterium]
MDGRAKPGQDEAVTLVNQGADVQHCVMRALGARIHAFLVCLAASELLPT